ncbi:lysine decarboxylase LdcC, partial [Escherichia coli]|nr:lysine decarboxylase LdcC [Escherichia coli]
MNTILIGSKSFDNKYVAEIISHLHTKNFGTELAGCSEKIETIIRNNARIAAVLLDLDDSNDILDKIRMLNEHLPVFLLKTDDVAIKKFCFDSFDGNVHLIDCCLYSVDEIVNKIQKIINDYIDAILPPLTKALFNYVKEGKYTFCTPGHMGGTAYQKSP